MALAISYPSHLVKHLTLRDGTALTLRPIRPGDAAMEDAFVRALSDESRYYRFMDHRSELSPSLLTHLTEIDYRDHMALIATTVSAGAELQVGVARYVVESESAQELRAEFALVVADAWQNRGIGRLLMAHLITAAQERGITQLFSDILASNHKMLGFMRQLEFVTVYDPASPGVIHASRTLTPSSTQRK
jgi:acetyltransferase